MREEQSESATGDKPCVSVGFSKSAQLFKICQPLEIFKTMPSLCEKIPAAKKLKFFKTLTEIIFKKRKGAVNKRKIQKKSVTVIDLNITNN